METTPVCVCVPLLMVGHKRCLSLSHSLLTYSLSILLRSSSIHLYFFPSLVFSPSAPYDGLWLPASFLTLPRAPSLDFLYDWPSKEATDLPRSRRPIRLSLVPPRLLLAGAAAHRVPITHDRCCLYILSLLFGSPFAFPRIHPSNRTAPR